MSSMCNLNDKNAIVTGGASGIGYATARMFIARGANVMIADYSDTVEQAAKELGAVPYKVDVTQADQVEAMVEAAVREFGRLDIVVASAGIGGDNNNIADETIDNWEKVNAVDYTGVMLTNRFAVEQMLKQGRGGAIINLASMFGLVAVPTNIAYSASKAGVLNLTRAAGAMYAANGIRVNAVCPGVIDTPLVPEAEKEAYEKLHPAARLGTADEVAKLITFLASDDATFINATSIAIDGGYTAV